MIVLRKLLGKAFGEAIPPEVIVSMVGIIPLGSTNSESFVVSERVWNFGVQVLGTVIYPSTWTNSVT